MTKHHMLLGHQARGVEACEACWAAWEALCCQASGALVALLLLQPLQHLLLPRWAASLSGVDQGHSHYPGRLMSSVSLQHDALLCLLPLWLASSFLLML